MGIDTFTDAMLMRKMFGLRDGIMSGNLNPLWVEWTAQRMIDNDHSADFALRPVWAMLVRPKLSEIERIIGSCGRHQEGMESKLDNILRAMNWSAGPDELDLTVVTMKNLFLDRRLGETEGLVINCAKNAGLEMCPDWVVPAIAIHAEENCQDAEAGGTHFNLCLSEDEKRNAGFGMFYRLKWHYYRRCVGRSTGWSNPINWMFVKPRTKAVQA